MEIIAKITPTIIFDDDGSPNIKTPIRTVNMVANIVHIVPNIDKLLYSLNAGSQKNTPIPYVIDISGINHHLGLSAHTFDRYSPPMKKVNPPNNNIQILMGIVINFTEKYRFVWMF